MDVNMIVCTFKVINVYLYKYVTKIKKIIFDDHNDIYYVQDYVIVTQMFNRATLPNYLIKLLTL